MMLKNESNEDIRTTRASENRSIYETQKYRSKSPE